jgi:histidinol phosphatase-like PHP family hydrolase
MGNLVDNIVAAISTQPIDVLANVMVLPLGFTLPSETLWTEEHMQRVIAAAAKNGVAFEINRRQPTPSEKFIRLAKAAGVKFTIGSDDVTREDYGDWSYLLEIQQKVGLKWQDMWVPGHAPTRAQRELAKN